MSREPPSKEGIYLYDDHELTATQHTASTNSSPDVVAGGAPLRSNPPPENFVLRTNFMTNRVSDDLDHIDKLKPASPTGGNFNFDKREADFGPVAPRFHSMYIIFGVLAGIGLGVLFFYLRIGSEWQKLVTLPGDLFVRALSCLIVPLVFCVLTVVVAETVSMGNTSILRWRTLAPYALTSILSAIQGMLLALMFQSSFVNKTVASSGTAGPLSAPFNLTMKCSNGLYLATQLNGTLACLEANATSSAAIFLATNQTIGSAAPLSSVRELSIMDQIVSIAELMVPNNIFDALANGSLLSIVMFTIPLGIAVAHSAADGQDNLVLHILRQLRNVFLYMLYGLLWATPVAVAFLVGGAASALESSGVRDVLSQVAILFVALVIGSVAHTLIVLPTMLYFWTKANPYAYIQHLLPAYIFAFGCASSMATLPVAIECIQNAKVSRTLAHITMPFGTPVNLNAAGLYYPLALVFMANMAGLGEQLTVGRWIIVFLVSLLGSMGTAPVPNSALVYILTLWKTCFPAYPLPQSFAWLLASDFLLDRIRTMVNVNGNAIVARILAEEIDETFECDASSFSISMDPPKKGILLYEEPASSFFHRFTTVNVSDRSVELTPTIPPRTNFMNDEVHYDSYQTPSVMLGDCVSERPGHDFGPAPPPFQSIYVFAGGIVGVAFGMGLYFLHIGSEWQKLVELPGNLFVRALTCLIVPMVFCVITIVVAEAISQGRSSILRWRTLIPYAATSILASAQGTGLAVVFQSKFSKSSGIQMSPDITSIFNVSMQCAGGQFMNTIINGSAECGPAPNIFLATQDLSNATLISTPLKQSSLMDQFVAIVNLIVTKNIYHSLVDGSLLSITMFALPLGVAIAYSEGSIHHNVVLNLMRQIRNIFLLMLNRLMAVTPVAVVFLIGGAVSHFDTENFDDVIYPVGYLFLSFMVCVSSHCFVVLPFYLYIRARINPYPYLQQLIPAYVFAFGCASSMATLPVSMACIQRAKISRALTHITMPFGTPTNLNASGLYYPLAVVFMANLADLSSELTITRYVVIYFVSWLGCMGTAPVPNSGLVYIVTLWKTCFPSYPLPGSFVWIVAIDFVIDRISTMVNVNGNAIVTRILAEEIDEAFEARAAQQAN